MDYIQSWVDSVASAHGALPVDIVSGQKRPRSPDLAAHLPSPPLEDCYPDEVTISRSPKRRRGAELEADLANETPRAPRIVSVLKGSEALHGSAPSTRESPSKDSSISRNSSPRKQMANAALQPTGFLTAQFESYPLPPSLKILAQQLHRTNAGVGILPASLRSEVCVTIYRLVACFADTKL